ncbi:iron ABC transporter permease [Gemmobacter aquaticus]|uniref:Iron ABC transporter permease n=1 Tax=Gemmobacter aquaticus TaxID=490185 RepID=A0A917YGF9_9RHOB|nr:iron ABC transporter permease [Gemmobacter aquaticus]GGO24422.1 iron ABC transporter permease [Gemmobacter aquaticus]
METERKIPGISRIWANMPDGWTVAAVLIGLFVLSPIVSVVWIAFNPTENIWPHLMSTVMPRYLRATLTLMLGVAVLTAAVGTGAAWLVTLYRFPGSRWLSHALLLPMAVPAYIGAYALVDFFDYSGAVQVTLRALTGWQSASDYWFPKVRSEWAAVLVLSAALYPYVYLLARAAFREQSGGAYEVARALGAGPWGMFWRVGLPLARPAIAAGVSLALMETVADYGTVFHFGVQTLTTGIFTTWLEAGNAGGAAQIAGVSLVLIVALMGAERLGRKRARFHGSARHHRPVVPRQLTGAQGALAAILCALPFAMGFVLPVAVMGGHALRNPEAWIAPDQLRALGNTLVSGGIAAVVTVGAALVLVYGLRLAGRAMPRWILPVTAIGYAAPGAVLALGILVPMAALDHRVADAILWITGTDPGLLITGTAGAIILAYIVRFFGIAQGAVDAAFGRISPNLPLAARALGRGRGAVLREVYLPMMRGSVAMALLVVFVDCVKELPATLLLRPFNYNTLATRMQELASLERLGQAAPAALMVVAVSLVAVALVARMEAR